jgi:hypothetical protein
MCARGRGCGRLRGRDSTHKRKDRMTTTSPDDTNARLTNLRELAQSAGAGTRERYAHLLDGETDELPEYALLTERAGRRDLLLGDITLLTALANDGLRQSGPSRPIELVALDSGERRQPVFGVFFAVHRMVLPLLIADLLESDLHSREGDLQRNPVREGALRRAATLIYARYPVPAELFAAIADVIELDLEDRAKDRADERDRDVERRLSEIAEQLRFRAPARNYAPDAPSGN